MGSGTRCIPLKCIEAIVNFGDGAPITMELSRDSLNQVRILRSGVWSEELTEPGKGHYWADSANATVS